MQKKIFVTLFISVHILFVILLIHKQAHFVKLSYAKQRLEKEKQELLEHKKQLAHQLHVLHNRSTIKQYAQTELGMRKADLKQIHTAQMSKTSLL